jgi:hypothetical protein
MSAYSNLLDPARLDRVPLGVKAERQYHSITHNPSTINAGETLYVRVPKLKKDVMIVPGTLKLAFDLAKAGHADNYFVQNVARNLQARVVDKLGGDILSDVDHYNIFETYKDLWLTEKQRKNRILQGIGTTNVRRLRAGAGNADKTEDAHNAIFKACKSKHYIPIDFDVYSKHGPFYPNVIAEDFIREITFNEAKNVISATDALNIGYKITNICIEYETVNSKELAHQIETDYMNGCTFYYDYVSLFKTVTTGAEKSMNINVNIPRRSMKGVLIFFQEATDAGEYDSESSPFQNPDITDVKVTIEGLSNKIYPQGFKAHQQWDEASRYFLPRLADGTKIHNSNMDMEEFYGSDKYALWLDLRSTEDGQLHGSGLQLMNTNDGVQLALTRSTSTKLTMHLFVIADGQVNIKNRQLHSVMF